MGDKTKGLIEKFIVRRVDKRDQIPEHKHYNCDYFVLDMTHDPFAKDTLRTYYLLCENEYPLLAEDIHNKYLKD